MLGFRIRLQNLPEQPGERRISVHWFFLPVGLGWLGAGVIGVRDWLLNKQPSSMYWGLPCAFLGVFVLITFVMCQTQVRRGKPPESLFTIRARQLVLLGAVAGYMVLCIVIYQLVPGQMVWAMPLIWLVGCALIWDGIVRYFRKHSPKH
jgi:xanthine/uracil/vitamin C permease (AzgA family)